MKKLRPVPLYAVVSFALFAAAGVKTRLVWAPDADIAALQTAGYCPLQPGIDRGTYGLVSAGGASALLRQIHGRRGAASVWLGGNVTALRVLRQQGWNIPESAIRTGLEQVSWPGRFELLRHSPAFVLDGSHNAHGMRATVQSLKDRFPGQKFVFLVSIMADKDVDEMLALLAPLAERFVTVTAHNPRAMPAQTLAEHIRAYGCTAEIEINEVADVVVNDEALCRIANECAAELVPPDRIQPQHPCMLGDDFASYRAIAPSCFVQVGMLAPEKDCCYAHHHGMFKVDEDVLPLCAAWMAAMAARAASR